MKQQEKIVEILKQYSINHHHEGIVLQESWFDDVADDLVKLLNLHIVSNNEASNICPKCHKPKRMQNNIIQLLCECDSEVVVGCHTCKHNPHAPFVPEICDECNPETFSKWHPTDC